MLTGENVGLDREHPLSKQHSENRIRPRFESLVKPYLRDGFLPQGTVHPSNGYGERYGAWKSTRHPIPVYVDE